MFASPVLGGLVAGLLLFAFATLWFFIVAAVGA